MMHPLTWWLWAIGMSIAVVRFHTIYFASLAIFLAALSVWKFARATTWEKSFQYSLRFAFWILLIRMLIAVFIGVPIPGDTLFSLPILQMPSWFAGVRIGGAVTLERLSATFHEVVIIIAVLALFGAATALTNPRKVLRIIPIHFHQLATILVIAVSAFPQLVESAGRIRGAYQLRGQKRPSFRKIAMPLLEDCLSRSLDLASSMESRGYGYLRKRSSYRTPHWRLQDSLIVFTAVIAIVIS